MKKRNIALSIIFTLITCGIYGLYWFVCLTDETNQAAGEQKTTGVIDLHIDHLRHLWSLLGILLWRKD